MLPNFSVVGVVQQAISTLLVTRSVVFDTFGQELFGYLAVIVIVFTFIKLAFAARHSGFDDQLWEGAKLLLVISATYGGVMFYHPLVSILTDQFHAWTIAIDAESMTHVTNHLDELLTHFIVPGALAFVANGLYWTLTVTLAFAKGLTFFIVAGSLIATAVTVFLGPLFVPWVIVPKMDGLFWKWFQNLLAYGMVQVVAQVYLFIAERFIYGFLSTVPPTITPDFFLAWSLGSIAVVTMFAFGLVAVPFYTYGLFAGSAVGQSLGGALMVLTKR